jgi:hypothetical protein
MYVYIIKDTCIGCLCKILKCFLIPCQANNTRLIVNSEICCSLLGECFSQNRLLFLSILEFGCHHFLSSSALIPSRNVTHILKRKNNSSMLPVSYFSVLILLPSSQKDVIQFNCPNFQVSEANKEFPSLGGVSSKEIPSSESGFSSLHSSCLGYKFMNNKSNSVVFFYSNLPLPKLVKASCQFYTEATINIYYGLDLKCPLKSHVLKA